jgi:cytochrome oxidase assembly protein ShyY1
MARYRFALRPKWILSHVLILLLIVVMVNLGFWQLRRLHERQASNDRVRSNERPEPVPIDTLLKVTDPTSSGGALAFRRVTMTGTYDTSQEVIIRARSQDERPGVWVASPLRLADGSAVVIVRGFLPSQGTLEKVPTDAEPPSGNVTVTGIVQETQTKGVFGATDPADGHLGNLARVDVERIAQQVPYPVFPVYVQLQQSDPAQAGPNPEVLPEPVLDDGPHLSYAVQWFIFSTIAVVGYPMILRRSARQKEREAADDDGDDVDAETKSFLVSQDGARR